MRARAIQTLIKSGLNYESHASPLSPPLGGGSSRGQTIPVCFERAPQYDPVIRKYALEDRGGCCYETQKNGHGDRGTRHNPGVVRSPIRREGGGGREWRYGEPGYDGRAWGPAGREL